MGRGRLKIYDHEAAGIPCRDSFAEFDLCEAQVFRRDGAEDIRDHHAHRRTTQHLFAEGAAAIAEHDFIRGRLDDKEVAPDAAFEIDHRVGDLVELQLFGRRGRAIAGVEGVADALADEADKTAGLVESNDVFKFSRKLADEGPEKDVAIERNRRMLERILGFHIR